MVSTKKLRIAGAVFTRPANSITAVKLVRYFRLYLGHNSLFQ